MSRFIIRAAAAVCFLVMVLSAAAAARDPRLDPGLRPQLPELQVTPDDLGGLEPSALRSGAAGDTFCIVWFDFEPMDWQGWTSRDNTAQWDTFFHVDDFAGLGGGAFGRLLPLEGEKSMWCGARPGDDRYLCRWKTAPGYGNNWDQALVTDPIYFTGVLTFSYRGVFDSEPDYDFTHVQYDAGGGDWVTIASWHGVHDTLASHELTLPQAATKLRFRFDSDGAWSDQDGLYASDGAAIVDAITISDSQGLINYEDFEAAPVGAKKAGIWSAVTGESAFGSYADLASNLRDPDPCNSNYSTVAVFFDRDQPHMTDKYPGLFDTPFCKGPGGISAPCQDEWIVSPPIDLTRYSTGCNAVQDAEIPSSALPGLGGLVLRYTAYYDLPLNNLVFARWRVRNLYNGCPGDWYRDSGYLYYGVGWQFKAADISDVAMADTIQIELGVIDMCLHWYMHYGDCAEHTPAPWYDNVRVYRYNTSRPQWNVRRIDLFQDTFPSDETDLESWCRADAANDINRWKDRIIPGDSAVVGVTAPMAGGLDTLVTGEQRVYCIVRARYIGPGGKPDLYGPSLVGECLSFGGTQTIPGGTYVSDDGEWTTILMPPARTATGIPVAGRYMIDLNDSLFTRGYMIEYYFKAYTLDGIAGTYPEDAELAGGKRLEFTCLPTLSSPVLFVDGFDGRGTFEGLVETYFASAFGLLDAPPDRYDINDPTSCAGNGVASRTAVAPFVDSYGYEVVIWDAGDLTSCTIGDGISDKPDDAGLLAEWLLNSDHNVGLWILGDGVAWKLGGSSAPSAQQLLAICGVALENRSYFNLTGGSAAGGMMTPLVTGVASAPAGAIFEGLEYYAYGGCPIINHFDVVAPTGAGEGILRYPDFGGEPYWAGVCAGQVNNQGFMMRTVWLGHSFMYIRDTQPQQSARHDLLQCVFAFFGQATLPTEAESPLPPATALSRCYPNPFNPAVRIAFALREKGPVSLRIYDVSGRLVRVLVDEVRESGRHEMVWDGRNEGGRRAASGIYFCRMQAPGYERAEKLVLLK